MQGLLAREKALKEDLLPAYTMKAVRAKEAVSEQFERLRDHQQELKLAVGLLQQESGELEAKLTEVGMKPTHGWRSENNQGDGKVSVLYEDELVYLEQLKNALEVAAKARLGRRRYEM